jgi:hypothetical protein
MQLFTSKRGTKLFDVTSTGHPYIHLRTSTNVSRLQIIMHKVQTVFTREHFSNNKPASKQKYVLGQEFQDLTHALAHDFISTKHELQL